ncbi:MAG: Proton/glutamate-aspartate symporter [Phycisphaerae bacterium]|nr:Proton/glutamate-aspartate symporter [Phycisphaerae bacterium]
MPAEPPSEETTLRRFPLHWQILIGLLVGGAAGLVCSAAARRAPDGRLAPEVLWWIDNLAKPVGEIFLRLIIMVVVPLVFSALVLGIAELGDVRKLGRIGAWTIVYTLVLSAISVVIGLAVVNTLQPGRILPEQTRHELRERYTGGQLKPVEQARASKPLRQIIVDLVPRNLAQEVVGAADGSSPGGGMLAFMFFALLFGIALALAPQRTAPLVAVLQGLYDVVMAMIGMAMRLAPLAVAALVFALTAELGLGIVRTLGGYIVAVVAGLALHMFGVYSLLLAVAARSHPLRFFARISDAMLTAFGTSSSNATLPTSLRVAQERLGLHRHVSNFVLTVGSTANQNGTALYEGVTVLFLAQVFGVDLTLTQQVVVALLCILAGIGTAGVPGGSLPLVVIVLQTVGVPAEGIGIILGVDRLLDMCRTTVNVVGDLTIAACVDRREAATTS